VEGDGLASIIPLGLGLASIIPLGLGLASIIPLGLGLASIIPLGLGLASIIPLGLGLASIIPLGLGLASIIPLGTGVAAGEGVAPAGVVQAAKPIAAAMASGASHRRPGRLDRSIWHLVSGGGQGLPWPTEMTRG